MLLKIWPVVMGGGPSGRHSPRERYGNGGRVQEARPKVKGQAGPGMSSVVRGREGMPLAVSLSITWSKWAKAESMLGS